MPVGKWRAGNRIRLVSPTGTVLELQVCPTCDDPQTDADRWGRRGACRTCGGWGAVR